MCSQLAKKADSELKALLSRANSFKTNYSFRLITGQFWFAGLFIFWRKRNKWKRLPFGNVLLWSYLYVAIMNLHGGRIKKNPKKLACGRRLVDPKPQSQPAEGHRGHLLVFLQYGMAVCPLRATAGVAWRSRWGRKRERAKSEDLWNSPRMPTWIFSVRFSGSDVNSDGANHPDHICRWAEQLNQIKRPSET